MKVTKTEPRVTTFTVELDDNEVAAIERALYLDDPPSTSMGSTTLTRVNYRLWSEFHALLGNNGLVVNREAIR